MSEKLRKITIFSYMHNMFSWIRCVCVCAWNLLIEISSLVWKFVVAVVFSGQEYLNRTSAAYMIIGLSWSWSWSICLSSLVVRIECKNDDDLLIALQKLAHTVFIIVCHRNLTVNYRNRWRISRWWATVWFARQKLSFQWQTGAW